MALSRDAFIDRFGGIYEHSAWVAEQAYDYGVDAGDSDDLTNVMAAMVDNASEKRKLELIRAHPDLAGKAAISGQLTDESNAEQASAGIDQCTEDEFASFQDMNSRYRARFGFPFVMAVRDSNRHEILAAFARRLQNDPQKEFATAIAEIHKIAKLRLQAMDDK